MRSALPSGSIGPRRLHLSVGPAVATTRGGLLRQVALVGAAVLTYFGVRNLTVGAADTAIANAERLYEIEQSLGIAWEEWAQRVFAGTDTQVMLINWVYIWGHWPVVVGTVLALYLTRRGHYRLLRNALFVSGGIGFLFFALLPLAPPRLAGLGLVDTVTEQSQAYRALQPPGLTNQYAAFPSLHVGWNILVGVVLFLAFAQVAVRLFAVLMPLAMGIAVVATANHFVLDVAAGLVVVMAGLGVAYLIETRRPAATLAADGVDRDDRGGRPLTRAAVRRGPPRGQPPR